MPSGADHPANAEGKPGIYKGLHIGPTGAGKTGSLAALLDAGYKLRVLDFDAGLDPIIGYSKKRDRLAELNYETLRDEFKLSGAFLAVKKAPAFQRAMAMLQDWPDGIGPVQTWGPDSILVIDTLGAMTQSCFNMVLQANGVVNPSGQRGGPEQSHYGTAMDSVERAILWLTDPTLVPCHVIVNAHWTYQESEGGMIQAYPETIGNKLSPKVGRKFNNLFSYSITAGQRSIKVQKDGVIACKSSKPLSKDKYSIETGMAEIFAEIVGPPPKS
jgi:hypothetical protein